jgi:hypothetical protein
MSKFISNKSAKNILSFCIVATFGLVLVAPFVFPALAHAAPIEIKIPNPLKNTNGTIPDLIAAIIDNIVIPIGGVIAILMVMYAGFLFVTARGDVKKITDAKQAILYACIGAAILLGSKVIAVAIKATIDKL